MFMKYQCLFLIVVVASCKTSPGRLKTLTKRRIPHQDRNTSITINPISEGNFTVQYTGCGGMFFLNDDNGIMIDPCFSHQKVMRIGASLLGGGTSGRRRLSSNSKMINAGIKSIERNTGSLQQQVSAIFSAHSHYDHLMDVPAVFDRLNGKPTVYLNQSG